MNRILSWSLPIGLFGISALCAVSLASMGSNEPGRDPAPPTPREVAVVEVDAGEVALGYTASGVVEAAQDVSITPSVSGELVWVREGLHAGEHVSAGTLVARIDPTAYEASVAEARTRVATAEQELVLEEGRGEVALLERELVGELANTRESIVRREPQLAAARAELAAAEAALAQAQRELSLTRVTAPFDAILVEESLDLGRSVSSGAELGRWVGTATAHIRLSVPTARLATLAEEGRVASVQIDGSTRQGTVLGATGELDAATRTATVLIAVDQPFATEDGPALLPGSYVQVSLDGGTVDDAVRLPASALVDGQSVWTVDAEDRLQRVGVDVLWRASDGLVVRGVSGRVLTQPSTSQLAGQTVTPVLTSTASPS